MKDKKFIVNEVLLEGLIENIIKYDEGLRVL